jgi:hypothetical protein
VEVSNNRQTAHIEEAELPGMPAPVAKRRLSRKEKFKLELEEYRRVMQGETGPLIVRTVAAELLGVSRQRVDQLVDLGRLSAWQFFDARYLSLPELISFSQVARPTGLRRSAA